LTRLLIVEDDEFILSLLRTTLANAGYETVGAESGELAWEMLQADQNFRLLLLDRQLPGMDGLTLLKKIKADERLSQIPVIMETGMNDAESILEGLSAGAYYYLTKPVHAKLLLAVVAAALNQVREAQEMRAALDNAGQALKYLDNGTFTYRTLDESRLIAQGLAKAFPEPERVVTGLTELMVNAVEHGNLGITYAEKSQLMQEGNWYEEVQRRLSAPEYAGYRVTVDWERGPEALSVRIRDQGQGFDWQNYLEFSAERAFDVHGRGIAMAKMMSFDALAYEGNGNTVLVQIHTAPRYPGP
jgi:DNA-binding response OmpR family regulator